MYKLLAPDLWTRLSVSCHQLQNLYDLSYSISLLSRLIHLKL